MIDLGYDLYTLECGSITYYLQLLHDQQITIYHLKKINPFVYQFYAKRKDFYTIKRLNIPIHYIKSIGPLYYLTLFFRSKVKLFGVVVFILTFLYMQQHLLNIKIKGTQYEVNQQIVLKLQEENIEYLSKKPTLQELEVIKSLLLETFQDDIDWLNIYLKGEALMIEYTNKQSYSIKEKDVRPIVACKEAVIKEFQVSRGEIISKINQYVLPGDVLVSNAIVSTFDETKILYPDGKIYGYTWYDIEKEMEGDDEGEAFSLLLQEIRQELATQLSKDALIDKENILHFTQDDSTIRLRVHYTVIEDIGCKGDINE